MMKLLMMLISLGMVVGCGGMKSYKPLMLSDGSQLRFHSVSSHDSTAPTITVMALETCTKMELPTEMIHEKVISEGDGTFEGGYTRKDVVTTEDSKISMECDVQQVGHAYGQSRVRDWLGFGQAAVGAAGFAYGLHSLEPNRYNSSTQSIQNGGGASSTSASQAQGGQADAGAASSNYNESNSANSNALANTPYSVNNTEIDSTQHITTDDAVHSDDNNVISRH